MGMVYLLLATLSWSLVGVLVKAASLQFDSYTIAFARFSVGVLALGIILFAARKSLRPAVVHRWVWIGAFGKFVNYFFENMGISIGYSHSAVFALPVQTILLLFVGIFLFKDKPTLKGWIAAFIILAGGMMIALNGKSFIDLLGQQGWITLLFIFSGVGAALHFLSQKMLITEMDNLSMNYSVFLWASCMAAVPLPFAADWKPEFVPGAWLAACALGLITGLSFVIFSKALTTVKFSVAVIVSNTTGLFMILWSWLFMSEPITLQLVIGVMVVVVGIIMLNWPSKAVQTKAAS